MSAQRALLPVLLAEKNNGISGGIYNKMQVDFAYNSNHIEGSRLSHEQTRYIFETNTIEKDGKKEWRSLRPVPLGADGVLHGGGPVRRFEPGVGVRDARCRCGGGPFDPDLLHWPWHCVRRDRRGRHGGGRQAVSLYGRP